ncbi:hypothetical protein, partial [Helicobacter sp. 13S00482-2]|uniref:hypothetical protein n=1 Tax=Helicobacter sp. 13S00482-2 TaxID=1476200 RepID=UPI001C5F5ADB
MNKEMRENFLNSFLYFYKKLGDDSKIFFERLLKEAENVKNSKTQDGDFMGILEEELRNFIEKSKEEKSIENITSDNFIDQIQIKEIQDNKQSQANEMFLKKFTLPVKWDNFQSNIDLMTQKLLDEHIEELKNLNLYSEKELLRTPIGVYNKSDLFSKQKIQEFQTQYAKKYLEKLSKEIN